MSPQISASSGLVASIAKKLPRSSDMLVILVGMSLIEKRTSSETPNNSSGGILSSFIGSLLSMYSAVAAACTSRIEEHKKKVNRFHRADQPEKEVNRMQYPKAIMSLKEMKKLGFPETLLLRSRMEPGQTFAFSKNPNAKNSPILFDTEGFEKWRQKQAKNLQKSIPV